MMNTDFRRRRSAIAIAIVLALLLISGCDSTKPGYRPPTAAVNGTRPEPAAPVEESVVSDKAVATTVDETPADEPPSADAPQAQPSKLHGDKPPFDPIEANGKFFEDWPKPRLALVITGRQDGYLEPCGCAGLENMKGGLSRRHVFFKELADQGWPVAAVDVGGMVRRFGKQAEFQFAFSAEALKTMGYGAVGFGPADLRLSVGDTVAAVAGDDPTKSIFISANVSLLGLTPKVRVIEAGGMKIGVTSVLGSEYTAQVNNNEVEIEPAAEALEKVLPELADCDVRILLAQATEKESEELAKQFPQFSLVVTADVGDIPPAQPGKIDGTKSWLIDVGQKGMYAVVAGFYDDPDEPIRFQRVALDSRFGDSPKLKQLMANYQDQLQQLGWEGLGVRSAPAPTAKKGDGLAGKFVGGASCKQCHPSEYDVWAASKHAHATDTLVKLDPPRQFDAECISCHATGWNAQEFYPYTSGFESVDKTPHLAQNSCENCHGPGAAHVVAERGKDQAERDAARELLKLTWPEAKQTSCVKCHDHDNSPEFDQHADDYWGEIEH